jgi:hypothetical protein
MNPSIIFWNRLETGSIDQESVDKSLRFEIHDPLWMLCRQWQFGEFEGVDASNLAFAQVETQSAPLQCINGWRHTQPEPIDTQQQPLEMVLERSAVQPNLIMRAEMGRHFTRLLKKELNAADFNTVIQSYKANTEFLFKATVAQGDEQKFIKAAELSDQESQQVLSALGIGRQLDGYAIYQKLSAGTKAAALLNAPSATLKETVNAIGSSFLAWCARVYQLSTQYTPFWNDLHQEYQVELGINDNTNKLKVIGKTEYHGEGHEWHGWAEKSNFSNKANFLANQKNTSSKKILIPGMVRFRGMPATRLWEMEDSTVDFGAIQATSTELHKMLYAEFGLTFNNDWLSIPIQAQSSQALQVKKILVTDMFGCATALPPLPQTENWSFFPTFKDTTTDNHPENSWILFANLRECIQESPMLENVSFLRDEMANLVWAVETLVKDPIWGARDGHKKAQDISRFLQGISTEVASTDPRVANAFKYQLGVNMPENWIPFVPVSAGDIKNLSPFARNLLNQRKVLLQRASLPRFLDDALPQRIRPASSLLGGNQEEAASKIPPMILFEEEINRTGMELSLKWRRLRGFDGQVYVWQARLRKPGRGEVYTNFGFDQLK